MKQKKASLEFTYNEPVGTIRSLVRDADGEREVETPKYAERVEVFEGRPTEAEMLAALPSGCVALHTKELTTFVED